MTQIMRLILLCAALLFGGAAYAQLGGERHMDVQLHAESPSVRPGGSVSLALVMRPKPGWHGYWQNPGDAGVATRADWRIANGAAAGPLLYPIPSRLLVAGLMNYVYERDYALLSELKIPAGARAGGLVPIRVRLDYLVCTEQLCVPESAELTTSLKIDPAAGEARTTEFDAYRQALPRPLGADATFERKDGRLRLAIPLPASAAVSDPYFFPITDRAAKYSAPQSFSRNGDMLIVETEPAQDKPAAIEGVVAIGGSQGLALHAAPGAVPPAGQPVGRAAPAANGNGLAILVALAGSLLGGLLLNIMPCVFPILSLKALSLARAGDSAAAEARGEGLAYTAGAMLVCLALGAVLLVLRAGGEAVGWAFQLQDPRVILFLLLLVIALTLNLAGLFELPTIGLGDRLARQSGLAGAFWTGGLAAFVATPCTGPFMGAALGAALVLPAPAALAIFAGLGLGLALPFLLLGFVPALRRRLPRPGPWMVRFKQILAIPMALTAIWLGWLLGRLTGTTGLAVGLAAVVVVAIALWWAGRRVGWAPIAPAALAAAAAVLLLPTARPAEAATGGPLHAEKFSEARLATLRAAGRPVFVYFTADWCLTCKVNEKAVLERGEVADAFARRHVAVLVGDWTRGDTAIGRFIEKQGRSGVPLYLWYAPGKDAVILPQILTTGSVTGLAG